MCTYSATQQQRISGMETFMQFMGMEEKTRNQCGSLKQLCLPTLIIARRVGDHQWTRTTLGAASDAVAGSSSTLR